jgi:hypothetical protein
VGRDISRPMDGAQQCNWKNKIISCQNDILKRETRANYHLHSLSQLLFAMEERALAAAAHDCVCWLRYQLARGW